MTEEKDLDLTPKVVFIGAKNLCDFLASKITEWNFFATFSSFEDFEDSVRNNTIDLDIDVIMTTDGLFGSSNDDFESVLARYSPYCLILVLNYNLSSRDMINNAFEYQCQYQGITDSGRIYFIPKQGYKMRIDEAVESFIRNYPSGADAAAYKLSGGTIDLAEDFDSNGAEIVELEPAEPKRSSKWLGQVVTVTSSKGGSGKSSVSVMLSTYLYHASKLAVKRKMLDKNGEPVTRPLKICLVDCNVKDGQLGFFIGETYPHMVNIYQNNLSDESIASTVIHKDNLGVDIILAPRSVKIADEIEPEFFKRLLDKLRLLYDYVIVDTSVDYADVLLSKVIYPEADLIVLVTEVVIPSIGSMARWISITTKDKQLGGSGIDKSKIGIVINKAIPDIIDVGMVTNAAQEIPILCAIPSCQRFIGHATNDNRIDLLMQKPALCGALDLLTKAIVGDRYPLATLSPEEDE